MFRSFARVSLVVVIALALGLAAVSPAGAGELRRPAASVTTHWLVGAWVWVQAALGVSPARPLRSSAAKATPTTPTDTQNVTSSTNQMRTGSCIDPLGNRVPCNQL